MIMDFINEQLRYQKKHNYRGTYLYITTDALKLLKNQLKDIQRDISKVTKVYHLEIFEIKKGMTVSYFKSDVSVSIESYFWYLKDKGEIR